jgi:hypothetical protein
MSPERYVALGLARARAPWFAQVARWSTAAALPLEFVKCLSVEEARARLESGRQFSALLADGHLLGVDRDLIDLARNRGCVVVIIDDDHLRRDWTALGAAATLDDNFERDELLAALEQHARPVADPRARVVASPSAPGGWRGSLVGVTGAGGAGTSTLAMALAQGLATDARNRGTVLLADLALHADQALLHDAREVVPGLLEVVEAVRSGELSRDELLRLTFDVPERGYRLLLGLRRHRDWAALRPRALTAALDGLQQATRLLVADIEADIEGEDACGSIDVEERNLLARTTVSRADLVVVVGRPGLSGVHRLVRMVDELVSAGLPPARLLPVLNRAPRSPRARAELTRAVAGLVGATARYGGLPNPLFVAERRQVDALLRDGSLLPDGICRALSQTVMPLLDALGPRRAGDEVREPTPVAVGSLGHWHEDEP